VTMIAMVSAKAAPGITTSVSLLATAWPTPVVVVDADPAGGDLASGWLSGVCMGGLTHPERSVVSFAMDTREHDDPGALVRYLQPVLGVPSCMLMAGPADPAHLRFVDTAAWRRLATGLSGISRPQSCGVDVLVDCGRFGPATPLALLCAADLVLIGVRPARRHAVAARCLATRLGSVLEPGRLGLAVCAASTLTTLDMERWVGLPAIVELPSDQRVARVFSDGARRPTGFHRSRLLRAAVRTSARLHRTLNESTPSVNVV
jgi:hypothetical protein